MVRGWLNTNSINHVSRFWLITFSIEEMFATSEVRNLPRVVNLVRDGMCSWQIVKLSRLVCD